MLNYKTIADLIAAFQSGVKFKADTPNHKGVDVTGISLNPTRRGRFLVTTGGSTHWHQFRLDGSHELGGQYRLYQVEAPAKAPVETAFPFSSADALVAAFNAGVKFEVVNADGKVSPVTKIEKNGLGRAGFYVEAKGDGPWSQFDLRGNNAWMGDTLRVKVELTADWSGPGLQVFNAAGVKVMAIGPTAPNPLRVTESGSVTSAPAPAPTPKRAVDFPNWLDELAKGTKFYCPATNEDVTGINVSAKGLQVMLTKVGVTGATPRHSTNYRLNGSHKHVSARSLVVKPEPVAAPAPRVGKSSRAAILKNRLNGQLFVVREGEVLPPIRGVRDAALVGETTIVE
ncbi:hypothetical protein [Cupriavidus nantongensis]|uniref:Uncharacterized protein n=1 Tax=Cupriavidus nantongensis TaxID=1796606 RepID=A0A142JMW3_9BURK|nr:hypothetical protein [Cupriavidus nantongensis]AMR79425.1 hypothetical protein A2G96_17705 [Cupriavidus nantongensis]